MSKIHFLIDKSNLFEEKTSLSHSRQGWRELAQRILNNELNILKLDFDSNVFQRYQEYKIEENERIFKVRSPPCLRLPSQKTRRSISIRIGSVLRYSMIKIHMAHMMILPSLVQFGIVMQFSEIYNQTERERNKLFAQKRVTIISPNKSKRTSIDTLVEDDSLVLTSPKWCSSVDELPYSSLDSYTKTSLPLNQRSSDDSRQIIINAIRTNSNQDGPFSSLSRKRHQNSIVDIHHDNNLSRLSLRSISYGFGHGTKPWKTIHQQKPIQYKNISSSPHYRLPANKIELDIHQQEIIRRTGSFIKKNT